jgi:hypothetical protein
VAVALRTALADALRGRAADLDRGLAVVTREDEEEEVKEEGLAAEGAGAGWRGARGRGFEVALAVDGRGRAGAVEAG